MVKKGIILCLVVLGVEVERRRKRDIRIFDGWFGKYGECRRVMRILRLREKNEGRMIMLVKVK